LTQQVVVESSSCCHIINIVTSQTTAQTRHWRFSRRKALSVIVLAPVAWLLFTLVRSRHLLREARALAGQSAHFKRDYFVGNAAHPKLVYVALGDSTAAGWGSEQLEQTYVHQVAVAKAAQGYSVHVIHAAVGGATLRDVLQTQAPLLTSVRPQLVTVSVGANDATHFTSATEYSQKLRALIVALQKSTAQQVLFANTPDMFQAPALPLPLAIAANIRARQQNTLLQNALRSTTIQPVDLYNQGKLIFRDDPNLYAADHFHPSGSGYRKWAQLFVRNL
jgi:lysophospholipase L1-like esterase